MSDANSCQRSYYTYYDTPEGCDIGKKTLVTARYGFLAGMAISTYDVLMYSHATKLNHMLKRYAFHTVPLTLMGVAFSLVANNATNFRGKNDQWNYIAGAVASAPFLGWYLGSKHAWFLGTLGFSAFALAKKSSVDNCWEFFPSKVPHSTTGLFVRRHDYTILPDPRDVCVCEEIEEVKVKEVPPVC